MEIRMSGTIGSVLKQKGNEVWFITPDQSVYDAIEKMAFKAVGALLVLSGGKLVGIISERDYARKVILQGKHSKETPVHEIMTTHLVTVTRQHSVDDCMRLMSDHRIRHLPVMEDDRLVGVVSIGDLVKAIITEQAQTIDQLHTYIGGGYPA